LLIAMSSLCGQFRFVAFVGLILCGAPILHAQQPDHATALAILKPYEGESVEGVDCSTLVGKVMSGYQGWFNTPDDGAGRGWTHYGKRGRFEPGQCTIDLWPDMSELAEDERFATPFRHADGSTAYVFSSHKRATVVRHFQWMREYGIDGAFVQRFASTLGDPRAHVHNNTVLSNCRAGANEQGRAYALMYDLSGLPAGGTQRVIDDWKQLVTRMKLTRDPRDRAYLHEGGKPVVAIWGVGFDDNRRYTLEETAELIRFFKSDPDFGGCTVMLGVPTGWRTLDRDAVNDPKLHEVIALGDIVSPWTVGRYNTPDDVARHATRDWQTDIAWCREREKMYLPVVFPGFSWHNLKPQFPPEQIPRLGGRFLWKQYTEAQRVGATMVYAAMFDEIDEGTAIFKCTNTPPIGASPFVTYDSLPSDHYLWLTGQGARLIRGEISVGDSLPSRSEP
jgi:hypothetical protein